MPDGIRMADELGRFLMTASFGIVDGIETCTDPRLGASTLGISNALQAPSGTVCRPLVQKQFTDLMSCQKIGVIRLRGPLTKPLTVPNPTAFVPITI